MTIDRNQLEIIEKWKNEGLKIGLITGLFETIHLGNLRLISFAKNNVDKLIICSLVGNSLSRFSNKHQLCDSLICLDNLDETEIVEVIQPDKIFKGIEWANNEKYDPLNELTDTSEKIIYVSNESASRNYDNQVFNIIKQQKDFFLQEYVLRHGILRDDLKQILDSMKTTKSLVFGDCIIDSYCDLSLLGSSQEDGLPVYSIFRKHEVLGGAFLPASIVENIAGECLLTSAYTDTKQVIERNNYLNKTKRLSVQNLKLEDQDIIPTKTRYMYNGNRVFRLSQLAVSRFNPNALLKELLASIDKFKPSIIFLFDFGLGALPFDMSQQLVNEIKARGIFIAADSQSSSVRGDILKFRNVDLLSPTELEMRDGLSDHMSGLKILMERSLEDLNCEYIITTLNENGVMVMSQKDVPYHENKYMDFIPALAETVNNTSGAGDTLLTLSSLALHSGATIWQAALIGSIASAIRVEENTDEVIGIIKLKQRIDKIYNKIK